MIRELVHFFKVAPEVMRLQKSMSQAEFFDEFARRADEQGFAAVRQDLVADLEGRVLEVGSGTGSMFQHYGEGANVEAIEPDASFHAIGERKAVGTAGRVRTTLGDGMNLDFPDASFDAVVFGLVLCSVPSMTRVLSEAKRVLRPDGQLRALEHVRSKNAVSGLAMDAANPLWLRLNKQGCNLNRQPRKAIEAAGFVVDRTHEFQTFETVMPAFPLERIVARRAGAV